MPIRGKGECQGCGKKLRFGGTHCKKCTTGGGGTGGYRSIDLPAKTAADIRREQTQQQRAAARKTKAAKEREAKHTTAIAKLAAQQAELKAKQAAERRKKGGK